jgi:hypothetical protein
LTRAYVFVQIDLRRLGVLLQLTAR